MKSRAQRYLSALIILGALFTIGSTPTYAVVPDSVNYQGILKTAGGSPVPDGSYSVTFKIYSVASGGVSLWTETKNVTTASGLFTTLLGSVTPLPLSVLSGPNRYLGITVNADPEMTPRTPIVAVAYALRIATVDGATGGTVSGDVGISGGNVNLDPSTATSGNVLKGGFPFINDFGSDNTFIGRNAGNLTTSGPGNAAIGTGALGHNTGGGYNTAAGAGALASNTEGGGNTADGHVALVSNTTGGYNTASGASALLQNSTGNDNTASGGFALASNTTGSNNTATGIEALYSNTTGNGNTASGEYALYRNSTGYNNSAIGDSALYSNTVGYNNVAIGSGALSDDTSGYSNTACGVNALNKNTTGLYGTANGSGALFSNTIGNNNTASGLNALWNNSSGSNNTACGSGALFGNGTGSNNTAVGAGANVSASNLTNATAIGSGASVNASNKIRLGNAAVTVIEGQVAYTFPSDSTKKENFRPVNGDEVLRKIRGFNLRSWNYIGNDPQQFRHYGPMAQEFFAAFGRDDVGISGTPTTINSGDEAGILMIAIQALEKKNEALEKRTEEVDAIKAENQDLQAQIAELREMIRALASKPK